MDLRNFENKTAGSLSGGNKRKLSVAIAMIGDPPIVFLGKHLLLHIPRLWHPYTFVFSLCAPDCRLLIACICLSESILRVTAVFRRRTLHWHGTVMSYCDPVLRPPHVCMCVAVCVRVCSQDPVARRFMWNVIARIVNQNKQCSIILTTHRCARWSCITWTSAIT